MRDHAGQYFASRTNVASFHEGTVGVLHILLDPTLLAHSRMPWQPPGGARAACIASWCCSQRVVEPSMSVNRKVTVPVGKSAMGGLLTM